MNKKGNGILSRSIMDVSEFLKQKSGKKITILYKRFHISSEFLECIPFNYDFNPDWEFLLFKVLYPI